MIARYLRIDIERVRVDASPPNRIRVRIQGATARQCEYIADCLSPDLPGDVDLLVEALEGDGDGTGARQRAPASAP